MEIEVPQDRKSTFEPQIVPKHKKIISMYAKGIITCQISDTLMDIFEASE